MADSSCAGASSSQEHSKDINIDLDCAPSPKRRRWLNISYDGPFIVAAMEHKDIEGKDIEGKDIEGEDIEGKDIGGKDIEGKDIKGKSKDIECKGKNIEGKDIKGIDTDEVGPEEDEDISEHDMDVCKGEDMNTGKESECKDEDKLVKVYRRALRGIVEELHGPSKDDIDHVTNCVRAMVTTRQKYDSKLDTTPIWMRDSPAESDNEFWETYQNNRFEGSRNDTTSE